MEKTNTILSRRKNLSIERCSCCDNIILYHKNLLLKFSPKSFQKFTSTLIDLDFNKRSITFADGTERMVINTQQKEVQMCFQKSEFKTICYALEEASVMLEVNDILYT
ncbi:hypothetical protein CK503_06545 [Aliifodinibius salipaludis]|uniref:Uncharacterized protein n=1 Tax=Fodinibius salipaludis TaxID=2032627 RepID=A0A2A2GCD4_9BACT|nr:DUF6686 family protein [Aliifodinibius salipaludis]PAU94452.1 hypothetical protein CK503_06545 [Aliifodinibius salipaludis]